MMPSSAPDAKGLRDLETLARVATLYYLDDRTQEEIARTMGISRVKVGRLLKRARAEGVVEIRVHTHPALNLELETALARRFGLRQALLTGAAEQPDAQRARVGQAAAGYLARILRPGMSVAVGMGRNVAAVADQAPEPTVTGCRFVSAIGGSPLMGPLINSNDIARRLARRFGGQSEELYAPAYAENRGVRDSFLSHDDVRQTLERAREAQVALVGIGDACAESAVVRIGCFSVDDMERLRAARAVGDILGSFFDRDGNSVHEGMQDRVIGLDADELRRIPCVVGIASEADKADAVRAALRSGVLDVLVATTEIGRQVLGERGDAGRLTEDDA